MNSDQRNSCIDFLQKTPIKTLERKDHQLIDVQETCSLSQCLHIMKEKNVLSLPVYYEKTEGEIQYKEYVGVVNLFEVLVPLAFKPYEQANLSDSEYFQKDFENEQLNQPVSDWLGTSKEGEFLWSAKAVDPIYSLVEKMSKGVHRYLVEDRKDGKPYFHLITQTDFLKFLISHKKEFQSLLSLKLSQMDLVKPSELKLVHLSSHAVDGLRELYRENISAVGVIDDNKKLVGNFSLSDLRGITGQNVSSLLQPISEFLNLSSRRPVVTCTAEDTLEQVIEKMLKEKVHRLWIVDEEGKPVSVCTMSTVHRPFF